MMAPTPCAPRSTTRAVALFAMVASIASLAAASPPEPAHPSVLFLMVDDLRPNLGAYGHDFMRTPHMDALAASGMLFQRAYVQYSFCAPSRNVILSGRRPDATRVFSFTDHFREAGVGDQWVTLPQQFKDAGGYTTNGTGKTFHPGLPPSFDAAKSWDNYVYPGSCNGTTNGWPVKQKGVNNLECPAALMGCPKKGDAALVASDHDDPKPEELGLGSAASWCAIDTSKLTVPLSDDLITQQTIEFLEAAAADVDEAGNAKPFFIGAGFHRPHLPFAFPQEFGNLYPLEDIAPARVTVPPKGMPMAAWHEAGFDNKWDQPSAESYAATYRRAYYSAVSYTDSNVGKVLTKLDELGLTNTTIVSLIGDHGWQLSELNLWKKMTNFDLGTAVPLIMRVPWKPKSVGVKTTALAESVDLMPTLMSLANLPTLPPSQTIQGTDLSPLFDNPVPHGSTGLKQYAFSQFAKRMTKSKELGDVQPWDVCTTCNHSDIDVHGYSVRSDEWRYTTWQAWNKTSLRPIWDRSWGAELYNHSGDYAQDFDRSSPTQNLWNTSDTHRAIAAQLHQVVVNQFSNDHLPPQSGNAPGGATAGATGVAAACADADTAVMPDDASSNVVDVTATVAGARAAASGDGTSDRVYGMFLGLQYYGPPVSTEVYHRVAAAASKIPVYVSVCADHNDTSGGAEHRKPGGDPLDGGRITPICDLSDAEAVAVRAGLGVLRDAGVHVLHYTHTRLAYYPNGTEEKCCECCEDLGYVLSRVDNITRNFPEDGVFVDNVVGASNWYDGYYKPIAGEARKVNPKRSVAFNPNCAHDSSERCSPNCSFYGHTPEECADCSSNRCSRMTPEFLELADVHLLSEGTANAGHDPDFDTNFPFPLTDAQKSKFSMFTYNANASQWQGFIDSARAKGFSKFFVTDVSTTAFLDLPAWFEDMVDYIAGMNQ